MMFRVLKKLKLTDFHSSKTIIKTNEESFKKNSNYQVKNLIFK